MRLAPALALLLALAAPVAGGAAPSAVLASTAGTYDFTVGTLRLTAINDGETERPNDGKTFSPVEGVTRVLATAALPTDKLKLSFGALLVHDGKRTVLIDSGTGPSMSPPGRLRVDLVEKGIAPASITDIVISHPHFDHIGGLLTGDGKPAFPNARVHIWPQAWEELRAHSTPAMVAAIEPHLALIPADGRLTPHLRALAIPGHTPGHIGVEIASGRAKLLYVGDAMHHYVASVAAPDLDMAYDADGAIAKASRKALLARAADQHLLLYVPHFPFPGLGHVVRDGASYAWVPVAR